jgi:hypothetical protein
MQPGRRAAGLGDGRAQTGEAIVTAGGTCAVGRGPRRRPVADHPQAEELQLVHHRPG